MTKHYLFYFVSAETQVIQRPLCYWYQIVLMLFKSQRPNICEKSRKKGIHTAPTTC